jgi:hypothetical protein
MAQTVFMMIEADKAIEEIRAVRHRISAGHGHDIAKYLASLREDEKQYAPQLKRGRELLARRKAERQKYPVAADDVLLLRERPEK